MFNRRLLSMVPTAMRYIYANVAFQWVSLISNIALMLAIGSAMQIALVGDAGPVTFGVVAAVAAIVIAIRSFCTTRSQAMSLAASSAAKKTLRQEVYDKLTRLGPAYNEKVPTSEAVQVSVEGVEQLEVYFGSYLPQLFYAVLAPVTLFCFLAPLSLTAAIALLVCVPLIPVSIMLIQRLAKKVVRSYWGKYTDLGQSFLENIQGLTTLKIYQADGARHEKMNEEAEGFRKATMRLLRMQLNSINVMDLLAYGGAAVGIIIAINQFAAGDIAFLAVFAFIFLSAEFFIPMRTLGSFFHTAMNGIAAAEKMFALFDEPEPAQGTEEVNRAECSIACTGVGYSYDGSRKVLDEVDFNAPMGALTAVVGESGSGKSTLAGILCGRHANYTGKVAIGGIDMRGIRRESLMDSMTVVSHASYLFKGSVRENLLMGKADASDDELWCALERCRMKEFVEASGGLGMQLSEQAGNLSGGQRQRLSLARALLHDSPIYLFDEATSNIDSASEAAIVEVICGLAADKTVIMISHRLASIVGAQAIFAMEDGRIAQAGTHEELLAVGGTYANLWNQQADLEAYAEKAARNSEGICAPAESLAEDPAEAFLPLPTDGAGKAVPGAVAKKARSNLSIMMRLIKLVRPLLPFMVIAITLGVLGFLAAIFLTVFGGFAAVGAMGLGGGIALAAACALIALCGILRGPLRYGEQLANHYIAFKILALIRDEAFDALRRLAPAKLEGKDKGNLISLLTSDIELLEVFYAHTVSPIAIATLISLIMTAFIAVQSPVLAAIALAAYLSIGVLVPVVASRASGTAGREFRDGVGDMNSFVLDSLRGLKETLQYGLERERSSEMAERTDTLMGIERIMKKRSGRFMALTNGAVLAFDAIMLLAAFHLHDQGVIGFSQAFISTLALMSSFGPVIAVAALGSSLQQTFASGARVLDILDEEPQVVDVTDGLDIAFEGAQAKGLGFTYGGEAVLECVDLSIEKGTAICIAGRSGSGKSTFLKLLMRFWDATEGEVRISGGDIREVNTASLRDAESYMTQETHLFAGTIGENITIAKPDATDEELDAACRKAALQDLIARLPEGCGTQVGELGGMLSGGEQQRIGLARMFLHDAPFVLLDEPTSNLDSLNEAAVLRALEEGRGEKTIVLVSHRASTCTFADKVYSVDRGRLS